MNSEREVLEKVLNIAMVDDDIKAVCMNGSRVNKNIEPDNYQDFDIAFLVGNYEIFIQKLSFIHEFGESIISQCNRVYSRNGIKDQLFYMLLFKNYIRIDFRFIPIEYFDDYKKEDQLLEVLVDKTEKFKDVSKPSDETYHIKKPTEKDFRECCNEFWWISTYVIKGIKREEIFYAIEHLNIMREMLFNLLDWKVGYKYDWKVSTGKNHKLLKRYITKEEWILLTKSYPNGKINDITCVLNKLIEQFYDLSQEISNLLDFNLDFKEANNIKEYINKQLKNE